MKAMRWLVVLLLVLAVIPLTAKPAGAADPWASAYGDWQYRTAVTISNPNSADLTDFQVKVVLDSNWPGWAHVNSDGSDIRFATADGTTIPYWIESWDYTNKNAVIWIKVPSIPASGSTTVYLYYGNPSATDASDPEQVFEFFDDFDTDTIASGKWTVVAGTWQVDTTNSVVWNDDSARARIKSSFSDNGNYIYEVKLRHDETGQYSWVGLEIKSSSGDEGNYDNGYLILHYGDTGKGTIFKATSGSLTELASGSISIQAGQFFVMKVIYDSGDIKLYINEQLVTSVTDTTYTSGEVIRLFNNGKNNKSSFDWIRVRKYAEQEPSVSVSTTEEMNSGSYTVTLSLKDDAGNSLSGVTVIVKDANGNTVLSGTYNDGDSFSLADTGDYTIEASKTGYVPAETSVDITSGTTDYSVSLTLTEIPQPSISVDNTNPKVGDTITITLEAEAKTGFTVSYKYRLEDGSGTVLVDWTADSDGQFTYTIPQSLAHGTLVIKAKTVYDDGTGQYESLESSTSISIANSPPSAPTLSVSPGTVATAGDTITATASGSSDPDGDSISYEYKFEDVTDGVVLQDWSTTNSYTTNINQAGHVIRVWARAYDGQDYSDPVYVDVNLNNHPPSAPTSLTLSSGLHVGKQVTFTASGSSDEDGDSITYEYRIVDKTTGSVIRDWSSTNTFTPSSGQLYHAIEIFARAVDSKGAASDAVSRVYFVLPGETIADVPFDPGQVKSKVIFTLSSAWTDVTGLKVKLDGQTSGGGTLFLLASFNGVHWWVNITGDKVILYSDDRLGFMCTPILSKSTLGSNKWARDYVQAFVDFAQEAGTLEGTAISPGTYIQSYDAYVAGINQEAVAYAVWISYAEYNGPASEGIKWYLTNMSSVLADIRVGWAVGNFDDGFYIDIYDSDENAGTSPEYSHGGLHGGIYALKEYSITGLKSWLENRTYNFYMYTDGGWAWSVWGAVRVIAVGPSGYNPPLGSVSKWSMSYSRDRIVVNVKPLPVPTKVTFWFYDENNNPLNGVDVYLGNTFLGTFDSGQSYQLDYAGTYTFTAKKLHYVDTTVTTYVEGNAGVSFTLELESYDVTVRITDEHGNLINATLYIDGQNYGTVDETTVALKYGSHTFRAVDSEGYSGETTAIIDHNGQVVTITIEHPVTVTFKIYDSNSSAELTGVILYVDGASYGSMNSGDQLQFLRGLHSFKFEKDGYLTTTLTINLQSDTTLTVFLLPGSDSEEGLGTWPGMNISQWNITPINSYAKALIDSGGMFGDTIKNAIRADTLMKLLLPQLLTLAIVIFILVQTQSPIAGIGGALIMQAMFTAILGEAPNLRNSSLTFMLIVFLAAWTMWDLFVNYSRET